MNNGFNYTEDIQKEIITSKRNLSLSIQEAIYDHCYSNTIEITRQEAKNNTKDWNSEILIFNYVSSYLKSRFPNIFIDKTIEEQLTIIYEGIEIFLEGRDRKNQIPRVLGALKKTNKLDELNVTKFDNVECDKLDNEKNTVIKKIFAVFI